MLKPFNRTELSLNHRCKTVGLNDRPVGAEDVERRRFVTAVVHLHHGVGDGGPRHHLLVLDGAALEGLPHIDVLQGDWREEKKNNQLSKQLDN